MISIVLLNKIKTSLRIDVEDYRLDEEIQDLIDAAIADLKLSGVKNINETDPLIIRAVTVYCKAEYSTDDKEAERYRIAYDMLKSHMALSNDYIGDVNET